jgi:dephospho-CoA kinase
MIIGIGGTNGAGKDTVATMLRDKYGYLWIDATNLLTAELKIRKLPLDREHKSALSAEWRREIGMAAIVDKAVAALKASPAGTFKGLVVGSLRHPGEADRVHELGGILLWIDADPAVRYRRVTSVDRGRSVEDNKTYEEFLADEKREMTPSGDAATLNMQGVKERADQVIQNDSSDLTELTKTLEDLLTRYNKS